MIDARTASKRFLRHLVVPAALAATVLAPHARAEMAAATTSPAPAVTHYRTATVDGVSLFYREAGPVDAPLVLCCTGSRPRPTCSAISSRSWRTATM